MEKLPNRNTPKPGTAKDEKISPKKTRRSRRKQRKQSEEHQKYLVPDSIAHLTSMKSRSVNGYVQPNFIPSPTTSASIVPVPLMSINTSTAVIQNMHLLPSTSNKNKSTSREETKIANKKEKKEKWT
ncbi:hypothetical protein HHI36_013996 [Cryptolaemus montrouzieri]|uniref:Uncharacterized protein n=1 Tax=Cryptolaemus montrouzieri TaxID=559131 RepID=A0ABD2N195_9CUCU